MCSIIYLTEPYTHTCNTHTHTHTQSHDIMINHLITTWYRYYVVYLWMEWYTTISFFFFVLFLTDKWIADWYIWLLLIFIFYKCSNLSNKMDSWMRWLIWTLWTIFITLQIFTFIFNRLQTCTLYAVYRYTLERASVMSIIYSSGVI